MVDADEKSIKSRFEQLCSVQLSTIPNIKKLKQLAQGLPIKKLMDMVTLLRDHIKHEMPYTTIVDPLVALFTGDDPGEVTHRNQSSCSIESENTMPSQPEMNALSSDAEFDTALAESIALEQEVQRNISQQCEHALALLGKEKFKIVNVPPDGNCLLHALLHGFQAHDIESPSTDVESLRRELVRHMKTQPASWFDLPQKTTKAAYIKAQSRNGEWCDINAIRTASVLYQRQIAVTSQSEDRRLFKIPGATRGRPKPTLELVLVNLNHYMFACPVDKCDKLSPSDM